MNHDVVFLHGFLGGSWTFEGVQSALTRRRCLLPALAYHDPNVQDPLPRVGFVDEVERLARAIGAIANQPVDLVGYSLGGRLALGIAVCYPHLVRRLVLISSRRGIDDPTERAARCANDESWACLIEQAGLESFLREWWQQPLFQSLAHLPKDCLERELSLRRLHRPAALASALRNLGLGAQPSYSAEVQQLGIPVTLVVGERDEKFRDLAQKLALELPRAECRVVAGVGHHLPLEAPSAIARILLE